MSLHKILASFCILAAILFSVHGAQAQDTPASKAEQISWQKVENNKVCMVTDMVFPRVQIPVTVEGKTYYGCCENCKDRLSQDAKVRSALDPVSGKAVDKAKAFIVAGPDGSVLYFENEANFKSYTKQLDSKPKSTH